MPSKASVVTLSPGVTFVDTNVLIYSVDSSTRSKMDRAWEWLNPIWEAEVGRISWQVLHEFYVNAIRKARRKPDEVREVVRGYLQWTPLDSNQALVERAWHWLDEAQVSYGDGLIVAAAERSGARYLLTEDLQDGRRFGHVMVVNPFLHQPSRFGFYPHSQP